MAPKFVFFDSNTWIYLANGFEVFSGKYLDLHFKVFDILERRVSDGSLVIFTNEIVKEEWKRNEEESAKQLGLLVKRANSYKDQLLSIGEYLGHNETQIEQLIKAVDMQTDRKIHLNRIHIAKVKQFIEHKTENIAICDRHRIEASVMAQRKQAPFRGDKSNSMSDALILLSITDFLDTSKPIDHLAVKYAIKENGGFDSYFITSNFGDFANLPDKHTIHPDLEPILARSGTVYHPSLGPLMEQLEKEFLTQDELRALEATDRSIHCYICDCDYPSLKFSEPIRIYDPYKSNGSYNLNQLLLFDDIVPVFHKDGPYSNVETGYCRHCNTDFIVCPNCDCMFNIEEDETVECPECYYKFLLEVEKGFKDKTHSHTYSIVQEFTCIYCGDSFHENNTENLCEFCLEYQHNTQT